MEFSTMKTLIEQIIESKNNIKEEYYSNSNGSDSTYCPYCNASASVIFRTGGWTEYRASIADINY